MAPTIRGMDSRAVVMEMLLKIYVRD